MFFKHLAFAKITNVTTKWRFRDWKDKGHLYVLVHWPNFSKYEGI